MRHIIKQKTPKELKTYKSTPNATYDGFQSRDVLRLSLIKEQKGLCAYCNGRISNDWDTDLGKFKTEIEHYKSQELSPELHLDYSNMLGVCNGNSGNVPRLLHCDKSRPKKSILSITPLSKNCETHIKYSSDGTIYAEDEGINNDLNKILNLNVEFLKTNRKRVLDSVIVRMNRFYVKKKGQSWTKSQINSEIRFWETVELLRVNNTVELYPHLQPYCQIAIYYLQNKLKRS